MYLDLDLARLGVDVRRQPDAEELAVAVERGEAERRAVHAPQLVAREPASRTIRHGLVAA